MNCCSSESNAGINKFFSRYSKKYEQQFRKKGLDKAQEYLLEGIRRTELKDKRVLDIGCGVGSLHLTLLREGASYATGIDISEGMIEKARALALEMGLKEKTSHVNGDFVQAADGLPEADITMLDKVVCCYEDLDALIQTSIGKTQRVYGVSHPRDTFIIKYLFKSQIFLLKLFRSKFRPFWHDWKEMKQKIAARGFRLVYERPTLLFWNVAVFERM